MPVGHDKRASINSWRVRSPASFNISSYRLTCFHQSLLVPDIVKLLSHTDSLGLAAPGEVLIGAITKTRARHYGTFTSLQS